MHIALADFKPMKVHAGMFGSHLGNANNFLNVHQQRIQGYWCRFGKILILRPTHENGEYTQFKELKKDLLAFKFCSRQMVLQ